MIKTVGMIGRGAIGTLYGSLFHSVLSNDEMAYIVDEKRKEKYENFPLICNGKKTDFKYVTRVEEFQKVDLIFISTKYSGLMDSISLMKDFLKKDTIIVSCLNGISSEQILRKAFPNHKVIRTIVQGMDSTYLNHEVKFTVLGELLFGKEFEDERDACEKLEQFYTFTNIPFRKCENIVLDQWNKLMFNCGINQTCAAYYSTYGGCKVNGVLRNVFVQAMKEVKEVANAYGIALTDEHIENWKNVLSSLTDEGMPSMRQDIIAHRKTELDLFSGTILPLAKQKQIYCPTLKNLYDSILKIEKNFRS
ncbi:ketopantoate reductase family protein [Floccifex sp.]|uniref:ketopantoate reductase family protein n=1 Tax=Floccifex sp. TaxID=2815810 RepID=UPI003F061D23